MKRYAAPRRKRIRGKLSECFYVRRYDTESRQRVWCSTGKTSLRAALAQVRAWEVADATGKGELVDIPFATAVTRWLEAKQSRMTDRGYDTYKAYAMNWVKCLPEKVTVRGVTLSRVETYFRDRSVKASNSTLNKERAQMKQLFAWCREHGWCDIDPVATTARFVQERRTIRALSPGEISALLDACRGEHKATVTALRNAGGPEGGKKTEKQTTWEQTSRPAPDWLHPLVFIALRTGLRAGTLESLRWEWVDLKAGLIRIPPDAMKAREGINIPLDAGSAALLRQHRKSASSLLVFDLPERGDVRKTFQRAVKRAKIAACRFHDLRSTFITRCRQAGIDLEIVAKLVGHRDVKTTLKFYRRVSEEEMRAAVERLAQVGGGAGQEAGQGIQIDPAQSAQPRGAGAEG